MSTVMSDSSLLGCPSNPLGLQIRGTERNGQIVWLSSPKVTVGSDRRSTLRLRAPGVAPIHCLILRGSQHVIARRWSPDTRHNGSAFDETSLAVGDHLSIGPVEFEVVENKAVEKRPQREAAAVISKDDTQELPLGSSTNQSAELVSNTDSRDRHTTDNKSLRIARRLSSQLKTAHRQARRRVNKLTEQLRSARLQITGLEQQLSQTGDEAALREQALQEQRQVEWDQQQKTLGETQQQWKQTQSHLDQLFADLNQRLDADSQASKQLPALGIATNQLSEASDAAQQELASLRQTLETQQRDWELQRTACEAQLAQRQNALQQETDQLARLQTNLDRQQSSLEQQVASLTEQQKQLETQAIELRSQKQAVEEQQETHQAEVSHFRQEQAQFSSGNELFEQNRQVLEEERAKLAEQTTQLQLDREKIDHDQQELASLQEQLASDRQSLIDEQQSLDEQRQHLLNEQESLAAEQQALAASQQSFSEQQAHVAAMEQELLQTKNELTQAQDDLQAEIARAQSAPVLPQISHSPATEISPEASDEPVPTEETADSSDDVFARLRALAILKNDAKENDAKEQELEEETTRPLAEVEPVVSEEQPLLSSVESEVEPEKKPTLPPPLPSNHEEEESINDYMARLMQRVRAGIDGPQTKNESQRDATDPAKKVAGESDVSSDESTVLQGNAVETLKELEPRTAAPEKTRDLAAMREIANMSARRAIEKHHVDRKTTVMAKRMLVGIVGLLCGLVLVVTSPATHSGACYAGMAAIVVSLFWLVPNLWHARQSANQSQNKNQLAARELRSEKFTQQSEDRGPVSAEDRETSS